MTGFVRKATLLGVTGLLVASAAWANVPDCTHSTYAGWRENQSARSAL